MISMQVDLKMARIIHTIFFNAVFLFGCIPMCSCYPYGPPLSVCDNGLPIHVGNDSVTFSPQSTPSPFQINVNVTSYSPGDVIAVTVSSDVGEMFKGLYLQMREVPNFDGENIRKRPVGSFSRRFPNTKITACDVGLDTVFHKDPYLKMTVELYWKAPLLTYHDVMVHATVLEDFKTYWTNVESIRIKLTRPDRLPAEDLEGPWLEEIIKTVKAEDKTASRKLVKERFEKGFDGVMDPNGYIMVQYVNDLLPFQDSHFGVNNTKNHDQNNGFKEILSNSTSDKQNIQETSPIVSQKHNNVSADTALVQNKPDDINNANANGKKNLPFIKHNETDIAFKDRPHTLTNMKARYTKEAYLKLVQEVLNGDKSAAMLLENYLDTPNWN